MKQIGDKLVTCPCCSSNACYESEFTTQEGPIKTWLCMTCGFTYKLNNDCRQ
jgi:transposase-like protein